MSKLVAQLEEIKERLEKLEDAFEDQEEEIDCLRHHINLCRENEDEDSPRYSPDTDDSD